ncbi:MAG: helix-turn-helix domain-containing protein [Curvibacter sp.]|nr:helix-turn-helix domain-containing protein [Curvibacter sp.]
MPLRPHLNQPADPSTVRARTLRWDIGAHRFEPHFHAHFFVAAITQGECHFQCSGQAYTARRGDLVVIAPFQIHQALSSEGTRYLALYLAESELEPMAPQSASPCQPPPTASPGPACWGEPVLPAHPLAMPLAQALDRQDLGAAVRMAHAVLGSGPGWARRCGQPPHPFQRPELRVWLEATQSRPTLAQGAQGLQLSPAAFSRVFRHTFGMRAVFFRNQMRLQQAENLLLQAIPVGQVAAHCGYADQAHLTRELKKFRGVTPGHYPRHYQTVELPND